MNTLLVLAASVFPVACLVSRPAWAKAYDMRKQNLALYVDVERTHRFVLGETLEQWEARHIGRQPDIALLVALGAIVALGLAGQVELALLTAAAGLPLALALATAFRETKAYHWLRRVPRSHSHAHTRIAR